MYVSTCNIVKRLRLACKQRLCVNKMQDTLLSSAIISNDFQRNLSGLNSTLVNEMTCQYADRQFDNVDRA